MHPFHSTLNGKPATIDITDEGHVKVSSQHSVWGFNANLEPESLKRPHSDAVIHFRFAEGKIFRTALTNEGAPEQEITISDPYLAPFGKALGALDAVSARTPLPASVQAKLGAAYERLGMENFRSH